MCINERAAHLQSRAYSNQTFGLTSGETGTMTGFVPLTLIILTRHQHYDDGFIDF